jgi:DNA-binding phage protein
MPHTFTIEASLGEAIVFAPHGQTQRPVVRVGAPYGASDKAIVRELAHAVCDYLDLRDADGTTTLIMSLSDDTAQKLAEVARDDGLSRSGAAHRAICRALDGTPAPTLPDVDEDRWELGSRSPDVWWLAGDVACMDAGLNPQEYRQIAAKALQLAAEAETV